MTHERHVSRSFYKLVPVFACVTILSMGMGVNVAFAQQPTKTTSRVVVTDKAPVFLPPLQPASKKPATLKSMRVPMTSYTSSVAETDRTPFTAADGTRTYFGMASANFLPFGTKFRIPEHFGDKIFTVHDRMSTRYNTRVDVWLPHKTDARKFGLKKAALIEIIEMGAGRPRKIAVK